MNLISLAPGCVLVVPNQDKVVNTVERAVLFLLLNFQFALMSVEDTHRESQYVTSAKSHALQSHAMALKLKRFPVPHITTL